MAAVAAVVATVAAVGGTAANVQANREQQKAARRARDFDQRRTSIENARRRRIAAAERRIAQGSIQAQAENQGTSGSSIASGAVSSLTSDTASAIGAAQTTAAGVQGQANAIFEGDRAAARFQNIGAGFDLLGQTALIGGNYANARAAAGNPIQRPKWLGGKRDQ